MIYSSKGICLCWDYHKIILSIKKGAILNKKQRILTFCGLYIREESEGQDDESNP